MPRKRKEQTFIVLAQFTYITKGEKKSIDPKELVQKVNAGFKKLGDAGQQPWDDVLITEVKVFERD